MNDFFVITGFALFIGDIFFSILYLSGAINRYFDKRDEKALDRINKEYLEKKRRK